MCAVVERTIEGTGPLATQPGLLTPLPWEGWHARSRSLQVDGARADYVEYDPYRFEVPPVEDRSDSRLRMMLVVILSGMSRGTIDGHPVTLSPRQAVIIDGRAAMTFVAPEPLRAVRLFVDEDHLPPESLRGFTGPYALLKASPLVAGCVGLITGLLQVGNPVVEPHDAAAVSQPLIALQASLMDEALHQDGGGEAAPTDSRRARIEAHVRTHLADRALNVNAIAEALGVTVRTVHATFESSDETAAGYIRSRRIQQAQVLLAARNEPPRVGVLAARVGLSRDQLTRAFQTETGGTVHQWWSAHRPAEF